MSAASSKARFHLERTVPSLQSSLRKGIFTAIEIRAINAKRSDFEHTLHSRQCRSADYARYAQYEMNLASLHKKRSARLGVREKGRGEPQRVVFEILERGTRKFPADVALWMLLIEACRREGANKKIGTVFTRALRLLPTNASLWVLAAKFYAEEMGDTRTARMYLQRGLRFCARDRGLWREYVRLEMGYLAKLESRRKTLGLNAQSTALENVEAAGNEGDVDTIMLPAITAEEMDPEANIGVEEVSAQTLSQLAATPALQGAIPIAIFDAAMKQFGNSAEVAGELFELIETFADQVSSAERVLQHIHEHLQSTAPGAAEAVICEARLALLGIDPRGVEFPAALGRTLSALKGDGEMLQPAKSARLAQGIMRLLQSYLSVREELDEDIVAVLEASLRKYERLSGAEVSRGLNGSVEQAGA